MEIRATSRFARSYGKLPEAIRAKAKVREKIFRVNPFDYRLNTHKLHGNRKDEWVYSINHSQRIVFLFLDDGKGVLYTDVGTHDELY